MSQQVSLRWHLRILCMGAHGRKYFFLLFYRLQYFNVNSQQTTTRISQSLNPSLSELEEF